MACKSVPRDALRTATHTHPHACACTRRPRVCLRRSRACARPIRSHDAWQRCLRVQIDASRIRSGRRLQQRYGAAARARLAAGRGHVGARVCALALCLRTLAPIRRVAAVARRRVARGRHSLLAGRVAAGRRLRSQRAGGNRMVQGWAHVQCTGTGRAHGHERERRGEYGPLRALR